MPWQPLPVRFPDVELVVCDGLLSLLAARDLAAVHVDRQVPEQRVEQMVIVSRDGGLDDGLTDNPRVRVLVWAATDKEATDLALLVAALIQLLVGTTPITNARKLSGPHEVPDTSANPQRYLLFQLQTEGVPLA